VRAVAARDTLLLDVALPEGLRYQERHLDHANVRFDGAAADSLQWLRGDLRLDMQGPRAGILLDGALAGQELLTDPVASFRGDTLALRLDDRKLANLTPWRLSVAVNDSALQITDLDLAGGLGELTLNVDARPDSLVARTELALRLALATLAELAPRRLRPLIPEGTLTAAADLDAAGRTLAPWAAGVIQVGIADNPELGDLSIETRLSVGGDGDPPPGLDPGRAGWRRHSARLDLAVHDADTALTRVIVLAPLPYPGAGQDSVDVQIEADHMDLARLDPLLPGGLELAGRFDADARARGVMEPNETAPDLELSGGLRLTDLRFQTPDGSWMSMEGNVGLGGTSRKPVIRGGIDIASGLIRIPEPPPTLLPVEGNALLWEAAAPAPDSLTAAISAAEPDTVPPPVPVILPDLTFTLNCPGNLWLRGQGIDVELEGDLALHLRQGKPAIEGELKARQGTMRQLGRIFKLQRGRIVFYADEDDLNPELDMALGVRVGEYDISIALSGTANDPLLEFSSSPDLTESDIFSVLLFGKTSDELSEGQSGLMTERAAQIAAAYGSVALQESLAKELGVDVLSIAPKEGTDKSALTVGKYLNPRTMVRYEQVLDQASAFFVHLDYILTESQEWRVHSQISQGEASGVDLRWEKDW
jgi:autotransporter translocation and assembly factor TamB